MDQVDVRAPTAISGLGNPVSEAAYHDSPTQDRMSLRQSVYLMADPMGPQRGRATVARERPTESLS